jgi:hypothetical protein
MIEEELKKPKSADEEPCPICYENKICMVETKADTFVFSCDHRFCVECVRSQFTILIDNGDVLKLHCLQAGCINPASDSQLKLLFAD